MFKIILVFAIPVALAGGLIYLLTLRGSATDSPKMVPLEPPNGITTFSSDSSSAPLPTPKNSSLDEKVATLETTVTILNKKIDTLTQTISKLSSPSPTITPIPTTASAMSSSAGVKSIYIPLGYGGSSTSTGDFESITSQEITLDTASYPGYKQAVLEVNFKIYQGNGTGQARLYNSTDGIAFSNSLISTTSENYSTITSGAFNLTSGSKKYTLQLKSITGYSVDVQLARIRIDF